MTFRPLEVIHCDADRCGETFTAGAHSTKTTRAAVLGLALQQGWTWEAPIPNPAMDRDGRHFCPLHSMEARWAARQGPGAVGR